jgi:hypothetical protein
MESLSKRETGQKKARCVEKCFGLDVMVPDAGKFVIFTRTRTVKSRKKEAAQKH